MTTMLRSGALLLGFCGAASMYAQAPQGAEAQSKAEDVKPLAFDVVSVKPAAPGVMPIVPAFMRDKGARIFGLQRMAAPVWMTIGYAYQMQMSEAQAAVRKQPEWVRNKVYTETFRVEGEPTREQVQEMMRTMLADRFALQVHEYTRDGSVNRLVMSKPGVLGPAIKPHVEGAGCSTQGEDAVGKVPDADASAACGFSFYYLPNRVLHVSIKNTTLAGAARTLASIGVNELASRPLVDATGLSGRYDLTLEYRADNGTLLADEERSDDGAPTMMQALKQQLGMQVESGTGPVRVVVIDHIEQPTPD